MLMRGQAIKPRSAIKGDVFDGESQAPRIDDAYAKREGLSRSENGEVYSCHSIPTVAIKSERPFTTAALGAGWRRKTSTVESTKR